MQRENHFSCLIDALSSENGDTAVEVISQMDLERGEVEIISQFLRNPDPNTRKRTAVILANAGDSTVLDRLWERLTEEDNAEVRKAIREAIRKAGVKKEK